MTAKTLIHFIFARAASSESSFIAAPMRVPTASVRRAARAFEATTSAFTLPVIVAYDVDDAERALLAHGFVPNDPECAELAWSGSTSRRDRISSEANGTRTRPRSCKSRTSGRACWCIWRACEGRRRRRCARCAKTRGRSSWERR